MRDPRERTRHRTPGEISIGSLKSAVVKKKVIVITYHNEPLESALEYLEGVSTFSLQTANARRNSLRD